MIKSSLKITFLALGFWIFGLVQFYLFYSPQLQPARSIIDIILYPFFSLPGFVFLGFGGGALILAGIALAVSELIIKKYPNKILVALTYGIIIPGLYWFTIMKFMTSLAEKYPNGL